MYAKPIYVVDGARSPFLKSKNRPGVFSAGDLATQAGRTLLARQKFAPTELDEVILGCAAPSVDEVNIGRVAALLGYTRQASFTRWFVAHFGMTPRAWRDAQTP